MSYAIDFVAETGCIVVTLTGKLRLKIFVAMHEKLAAHPDLKPGQNRLYDFRAAEITLSGSELQTIVRQVQNRDEVYGERRVANLVSTDAGWGAIRMLMSMGEDLRAEFRLTRDVEEAKEWVGLPRDYILPADR